MKIIFEKGFQCLSGLHKGLVLLKDLPKPLRPNRTYMMENHFWKYIGDFAGPTPHAFTWGLVLLKDLPKTTNTDWCFSCPKFKGKKGMGKQYLQHSKNEIMAINKFRAWRKAINVLKAMTEFKVRDFRGSNASWNYVVVNASLRSYIIHHNQSGLSRPFYKGEKYSQYNIYNVVKW